MTKNRIQKPAGQPGVTINVNAELVDSKNASELPKGVAYAFSSGGRLIAQQALSEKGTASLQIPARKDAQRIRIVIGPAMDAKEFTVSDLMRRGAEERFIRVDPNDLRPTASFSIFPNKWNCWLLGLCFVNGTLLKRVTLGGVNVDLPVCEATVEVYEVDPFPVIIARLPDEIIEGLRDVIIRPWPPLPDPPPFREPFPGPIPGPDPSPFGRVAFDPQPEPPIQSLFGSRLSKVALNPQPLPPREMVMAMHATSGVADLQFQARTSSTLQFRQSLLDYPLIVRPLICYFYPWLVTMQLVATTTTDDCGHFNTFFFNGCGTDKPDLYFKAKQQILPPPFFPQTVIYAPTPIACHTYWNYNCGTEVTLYTTHPLARTCPPCKPVIAPNNWVLFMAVGNYPVQLIQQDSTQADHGLATQARSGAQVGSPFGGMLRFRVEFDNSLRDDLGVKYYQMSYRKGTSGAFAPLTMETHRHYTHEVGGDLILEVFPLGPQVVGSTPNLFEIPPALPPLGQWSFPDLLEDLTSAKFQTRDQVPFSTEHGKYQIKLDLFDETGAPVNIVTKGIKYRVPDTDDFSGDIPTADAATLGMVDGNSMIVTMHIDNNPCNGILAAPTINGTAAGDDCGVLNYDPTNPGSVQMDYTASHPHGFATHSFHLYRGVNLLTPPSVSGVAVGGGSFSSTQSTSYLLGGCSVAGFSENLYAAAMATDGWSRLSSGYDASDVRAFVLSPVED